MCLEYEIQYMALFDKLFKRDEAKKNLSDDEEKNKEFIAKFEQVKNLFISCLDMYNSEFCQCAYPRFQQIISIDCSNTGNSFKCYETDLLIDLSKEYYTVEKSELSDECTNEKWTCKKCSSTYEYGWSDFSMYVERQKLKLKNLTIYPTGKPAITPLPLYLGLMGHSYPSKAEMTNVSFAEFEKYVTEK
jgi:hypothetical protein